MVIVYVGAGRRAGARSGPTAACGIWASVIVPPFYGRAVCSRSLRRRRPPAIRGPAHPPPTDDVEVGVEDDLAAGPTGVGDQPVPVVEALLRSDPGAEGHEVGQLGRRLRQGRDVDDGRVGMTRTGWAPSG